MHSVQHMTHTPWPVLSHEGAHYKLEFFQKLYAENARKNFFRHEREETSKEGRWAGGKDANSPPFWVLVSAQKK